MHRAGSNPHNENLSQENKHDEFSDLLSFCCYCTATAIAVPVDDDDNGRRWAVQPGCPPPQVAHHKLSRPGLSPTRRFPKLLQPASQCQCKNCNKFQRVPQGSTSTNKDPSDVNTNANNLFSEAPCAYGAYDVNIASNVDCYLKINHEATNKNDLVYSLIEMEAVE